MVTKTRAAGGPDGTKKKWRERSPKRKPAPAPAPAPPPSERPAGAFEEASRFLLQAGFGGNQADIDAVREAGLEGWFLRQLDLPRRNLVERFEAAPKVEPNYALNIFWEGAIHGEDQLRQRMAYALSQIVVVSLDEGYQWPDAFMAYADILSKEAFGNYGDLLRAVTYSPAMGLFLSHLANEKANPRTGSAPDENYAREVMQLFTIGLVPLTPDGQPRPGETYGPADVEGLAAILTGLTWAGQDRFVARGVKKTHPARTAPMDAYPAFHESGPKRFLGYEARGRDPITAIDGAIAHLMAHPNVPPFVGKKLIRRLVTTNPTPAYVGRVAAAFARGTYALPSGAEVGDGRRGDLAATLAAVLFDDEARSPRRLRDPAFGRVREASQRYAHLVRAFRTDWSPNGPIEKLGPPASFHSPDRFDEQPWRAPSVFGSFTDEYRSGNSETGRRGLSAAELEMVNVSTVIGYVGLMNSVTHRKGRGLTRLDFSPLHRAASDDDPAVLADVIDRALLHGAAPGPTLARMKAAFARLPVEGNAEQRKRSRDRRIQIGLMMALTDPTFAVQR